MKGRLVPRRRPTQARSQATVDAILVASQRVLIRDGYAGFTTDRVAKVAGVSIGSLYEYFPSKDALLSALVDDFLGKMASALAHAQDTEAPLEPTVRAVIETLIATKRENLELNKVLVEELPRVEGAKRLESFNRQTEPIVAALLQRFAPESSAEDLRMTSFVLVHAIQGVLMEATRTQRALDGPLVDELTALAVAYLHQRLPCDAETRRRPPEDGAD